MSRANTIFKECNQCKKEVVISYECPKCKLGVCLVCADRDKWKCPNCKTVLV